MLSSSMDPGRLDTEKVEVGKKKKIVAPEVTR